MGLRICSERYEVRPLERVSHGVAVAAVALVAIALVAAAFHALLAPVSPFVLHGVTVPVGFSVGGLGLVGAITLVVHQALSKKPTPDRGSSKVEERPSSMIFYEDASDCDARGGVDRTLNTSNSSTTSSLSIVSIGNSREGSFSSTRVYEHRNPRSSLPKEWIAEEPSQAELVQKYLDEFHAAALHLHAHQSPESLPAPFMKTLNATQRECINKAYRAIKRARGEDVAGVIVHSSGENCVFELEDLPGCIIKRPQREGASEAFAEEYVGLRTEARALCDREKLYMVRIPECFAVEIGGEHYVIEENIEDLYGDYYFQKSLFRWIEREESLGDYALELSRQMARFIAAFKTADIKANNTCIHGKSGQVVMVDLDRDDMIVGLTKGFADNQKDGLFATVPLQHFAQISGEVREMLEPAQQKAFDEAVAAIHARRTAREEWRRTYEKHLGAKGITRATDPIETDSRVRMVRFLVKMINRELKNERARCLLSYARKIELDISFNSDLIRESPYKHMGFMAKLKPTLEAMVEAGVLVNEGAYKIDRRAGSLILYV